MENLWDDHIESQFANDPLQLRIYSSQLLGKRTDLVLHGGGNTSVKMRIRNLYSEEVEVLCVKGSGWDLATIAKPGFPAVALDKLIKLSNLETLSDTDMVREQRAAMIDPTGPNPSVEAILHALIPYQYVDHTHADAVVTITNTAHGERLIREIYGNRVLVIPYIMPGFVLAKKVKQLTENIQWQNYDGMILLNHGIFSFADDAKTSYTRMIDLVSLAEDYLAKNTDTINNDRSTKPSFDLLHLAQLRQAVAKSYGSALLALLNIKKPASHFANLSQVAQISTSGPLTPDHVIRTKRIPIIIDPRNIEDSVKQFGLAYQDYFSQHSQPSQQCLDTAPRWGIWPKIGTLSFGSSLQAARIVEDISQHTLQAIQVAEQLGGWQALPQKDIFDVEYWELEQAKLSKNQQSSLFQGKIALVTGAASGIGKACVEHFLSQGAVVIALDLDPNMIELFKQDEVAAIVCDVTNTQALKDAIEFGILRFGGLDIIVSNAGIFPPSEPIESLQNKTWQKSLDCNLTSHQQLLQFALPFLKHGLDSNIVIVGSKNVPAPGPGAAAYSVAKAGLTQLVRVAALEFAQWNIRVNIVHPNAVFDTAIWTQEVLQKRAEHYHMSIEQYKTNNLLQKEITSQQVAELIGCIASRVFANTTGSQIPIDGGNERVI